MSVLVLSEHDVRELLDMPSCVEAMEEVLASLARGDLYNPLRSIARPEGADTLLGLMPAYRGSPTQAYGLKEIVIVPANPHSLPAKGAVRHWFQPLRDAGADVREHPEMAHAKVVLSDDTVLAGTANLDALSLRQNWEMQLRIDNPWVADHFARELFDRDLEVAGVATMPRGWRDRAVNALMSAISPLL